MIQPDLVDIRPQAIEVKNQGVPELPPLALPHGYDGLTDWNGYKKEMYIISSVLVDQATTRLIDQYLPTDLAELVGIIDERNTLGLAYPFANLRDYTAEVYRRAIKAEFEAIDQGQVEEPEKMSTVLARYRQLAAFWNVYIYPYATNDDHNRPNERTFINRGVNTASTYMASVLRSSPELLRRQNKLAQPKIETVTALTGTGFALLVRLASMHINIFTEANKILTATDADTRDSTHYLFVVPDKLKITGQNPDWRLDFKEGIFDQIKPTSSLDDPRLRCLAMVDFGQGSSIKRFWDWHMFVAPTIYEYFYSHPNKGVKWRKAFDRELELFDGRSSWDRIVKALEQQPEEEQFRAG
jgi:hypothetical protein